MKLRHLILVQLVIVRMRIQFIQKKISLINKKNLQKWKSSVNHIQTPISGSSSIFYPNIHRNMYQFPNPYQTTFNNFQSFSNPPNNFNNLSIIMLRQALFSFHLQIYLIIQHTKSLNVQIRKMFLQVQHIQKIFNRKIFHSKYFSKR